VEGYEVESCFPRLRWFPRRTAEDRHPSWGSVLVGLYAVKLFLLDGCFVAGFSFRSSLSLCAMGDHGRLVERFAAGENALHLVVVDFLDPGADQNGGYGVAGEVRQCSGF